jgi:hypothetical protein
MPEALRHLQREIERKYDDDSRTAYIYTPEILICCLVVITSYGIQLTHRLNRVR